MTVDIVGFVYAGVVAAGGIMGYVKAGKSIWNYNFLKINFFHQSLTKS